MTYGAPSIDIVIVNWNAGQQLAECVRSVVAADRNGLALLRAVVVDNGSTDGSLEALSTISLPLSIVRNTRNRGFAAACNQGAQGSTADYLLFLNPDTRLERDSLVQPVTFLDQPQNSRVGILGIQLLDANGRVAQTCARFPTPGRILAQILGLDRAFPRLFLPHFMVEWDHR